MFLGKKCFISYECRIEKLKDPSEIYYGLCFINNICIISDEVA